MLWSNSCLGSERKQRLLFPHFLGCLLGDQGTLNSCSSLLPFLLHLVSQSLRAGTCKGFVKVQKTRIFQGASPFYDIGLLPSVFGAGMSMRAVDFLGTPAHHTHSNLYPSSASSLHRIYFSFFRVRPVNLWLVLNLYRGSSTTATPPSTIPIIQKHSFRLKYPLYHQNLVVFSCEAPQVPNIIPVKPVEMESPKGDAECA